MSTAIRHHPDGATLMGFAAGTLSEPLSAVIAAHITMCSRCRREIADLELLGGVLMQGLPTRGHRLELPALPGKTARSEPVHAGSAEPLPHPLVASYGLQLATIPWRRLGPGIWHYRLALKDSSRGDLRLLKIAPGRTLPDHGHGGSEITLVISGSYHDDTGAYRRGDIQDIDEQVEHQPIVDEDECVCLIASDNPARFKGWLARLAQPFIGM